MRSLGHSGNCIILDVNLEQDKCETNIHLYNTVQIVNLIIKYTRSKVLTSVPLGVRPGLYTKVFLTDCNIVRQREWCYLPGDKDQIQQEMHGTTILAITVIFRYVQEQVQDTIPYIAKLSPGIYSLTHLQLFHLRFSETTQ